MMIDNFLQIYLFLLAFLQDFVNFKSSLRKKLRKNRLKKGADVNESKFVLNIDFKMDLKPDGLCVYMKQLNKTAYNFSVSLILIPFFIIEIFLNKKRKQSYLHARI
jgi:hypothetical protein